MRHRPPYPERLADPGTLLSTVHEAGDGLRVRLRLARPGDGAAVRDFLECLSPETRQRRFLHVMPSVSDATVRHFTFFDPRERLVVAATTPDGSREQIVGLADVALRSDGLAELGVVVDDRRQARGIGKLLTEVIASLAIQQGARRLKAELLERNPAMVHLLRRLGRTACTVEDGVSVAYTTLPAALRRAA